MKKISGLSPRERARFGQALKKLREDANMTPEIFATEHQITRAAVSLIEQGKNSPTWGMLKHYAKTSDLKVWEIVKLGTE